jgi:hypothetical protein
MQKMKQKRPKFALKTVPALFGGGFLIRVGLPNLKRHLPLFDSRFGLNVVLLPTS